MSKHTITLEFEHSGFPNGQLAKVEMPYEFDVHTGMVTFTCTQEFVSDMLSLLTSKGVKTTGDPLHL